MLVRLIGLFIGWKLAHSFWGGLIGFFAAGWLYNFLLDAGKKKVKSAIDDRKQQYLDTLFTCMGFLAKADGRVSEPEIAHAERIMTKMGVRDECRQHAIEQFRMGASAAFNLNEQLNTFNRVCGSVPMMKQMLLLNLFGICMADGQFDAAERSALANIASSLGFDTRAFEELLRQTQFQSQFGQGFDFSGFGHSQQSSGQYQQRNNQSANVLDDAYSALGVKSSDSDTHIKKAYRKLMSQYHPDKLMGQGLPEEAIANATERAKQIQAAYDVIKKSRGIK